MRITGPTAPGLGSPAQTTRRVGAGTFSVPEDAARQTGRAAAMQPLAGIDALLALQGIEEPAERRRRGVLRGRRALDALDEIRVALLSGVVNGAALGRLKATIGDLKQETGDPVLDQVLAEIELRAEVELAKAGF